MSATSKTKRTRAERATQRAIQEVWKMLGPLTDLPVSKRVKCLEAVATALDEVRKRTVIEGVERPETFTLGEQ